MNNNKTGSECQTAKLFAVYAIWCRVTAMHYVGVTSKKPYKRISQHKRAKKQFLHKEIQRLGWEGNFDWWVVESHIPENLISEREKFWVNFFGSVYPAGYNKTFGGIGDTNVSEDTRKNLSASRMGEKNPFYGKHHTTEAKAAISAKLSGENAPNYGKHLSDDTCAKIAIALSGEKNPNYGKPSPFKGKKHTDETLAKMSVAHSGEKNGFFGKKHTEETKAQMRQSHLGKKHTEETKAQMRQSHLGKKRTEEAKERNRQAHLGQIPWNKGKKMTEEQKAKMRGRRHTDEAKAKIGKGNRGKHRTEEQKANLREKALARHAAKRAAKAVAEENLAAANTTPTNLSDLLDAVILQQSLRSKISVA